MAGSLQFALRVVWYRSFTSKQNSFIIISVPVNKRHFVKASGNKKVWLMSLAELTLMGLVVWTTDGVWCSLTKSTVNIMNSSELKWLSKQRILQFFITIRRDGLSLYWKRTISHLFRRHRANILDVCGQLSGLSRKLKGKILLVCKLHSLCFIHILWTTEFVGLQMPWKYCKNTSEGRSVYWTHLQ